MPNNKDIEVARIEQLLIEAKLEERIRLAKLPHAALPSIFLNDEDVQRALKQEAGERRTHET